MNPVPPPRPVSPTLRLVGLLLLFGLLAWGVWWYFEYKIQRLNHQPDEVPTLGDSLPRRE